MTDQPSLLELEPPAVRRAPNRMVREQRYVAAEDGDFYRTTPEAIAALMEREVFPPAIWEPACGDGAISKVLHARGHTVASTDLFDRGFGTPDMDFLKVPSLEAVGLGAGDAIITNPPFALGTAFAQHALKLGARKVALLCRLAFLEGQERGDTVFAANQLSRVWVFSRRITLWRGDDPNPKDKGGAIAYAWFVWERGHTGGHIGWIP